MAKNVIRELIARLVFDADDAIRKAQSFDKEIDKIKSNLNGLRNASKGSLGGFTDSIKRSKNDLKQFNSDVKNLKANLKSIGGRNVGGISKIVGARNISNSTASSGKLNPLNSRLSDLGVDKRKLSEGISAGSKTRKQALREINNLEKALEKFERKNLKINVNDKNVIKAQSTVNRFRKEIEDLRNRAANIPISTKVEKWKGITGAALGMMGAANAGSIGQGLGSIAGGISGSLLGGVGGGIAGSIIGSITSILVDGVINGVRSAASAGLVAINDVMQSGINTEAVANRYKAVFGGNVKVASNEYAYMLKVVKELGLNLNATEDSYAKFSASTINSGVTIKDTKEMFTQFAEVATSLHLNPEQIKYSMLAIEQMFNKGKVSTEELRRQLAEQIPGAYELAAKSMGWTTAKLSDELKNGTVEAKVLVPKLLSILQKTYTGALADAKNSTQANLEKIKTQWELFKRSIWFGGLNEGLAKIFGQVYKLISSDKFSNFGVKIGQAFKRLGDSPEFNNMLAQAATFAEKLLTTLSSPSFLNSITKIASASASIVGSLFNIAQTILPVIASIVSSIDGFISRPAWRQFSDIASLLTGNPLFANLGNMPQMLGDMQKLNLGNFSKGILATQGVSTPSYNGGLSNIINHNSIMINTPTFNPLEHGKTVGSIINSTTKATKTKQITNSSRTQKK